MFEPCPTADASAAPSRESAASRGGWWASLVVRVVVARRALPPLLPAGALVGLGVGGLAGGLTVIAVGA